jgi:hypothetical protein
MPQFFEKEKPWLRSSLAFLATSLFKEIGYLIRVNMLAFAMEEADYKHCLNFWG